MYPYSVEVRVIPSLYERKALHPYVLRRKDILPPKENPILLLKGRSRFRIARAVALVLPSNNRLQNWLNEGVGCIWARTKLFTRCKLCHGKGAAERYLKLFAYGLA